MSCGKLHEPGGGFRLHAPGHDHDHDAGSGAEHDQDAAEGARDDDLDGAGERPGWVQRAFSQVGTAASGAWRQHGYLVKPFAVIPAAEGSEFLISHAFSDPVHALAAAGAVTVLGEGITEAVNWRGRAVRPVRQATRAAVAAGGAMAAVGGAGAFNSWTALATLLVGAVAGGKVAYEEHKAHGSRPAPAREVKGAPQPEAITAGPDPRLTRFTERFCMPGRELDGVTVRGFREVGNGFMFELDLSETAHSLSDAQNPALVVAVAKLYDITRDCVTAEYIPGSESENHCQVVIRKVPGAAGEDRRPKVKPWAGDSTWNPETGTVDLGWFTDDTVTRYQFHRPGSGALMGQVGGVQGSGKTGTIHVLGAEAGQAKLCSRCGRAGNKYSPGLCAGGCDMHRVMAVWMGDAQEQGLSVWRGRADLTGWGLEGCVELLEFADQASEARGRFLASRQWTDTDPVTRRRRVRTGQGHFDVEIGLPLIFVVIDEFPLLVRRDLADDDLRSRVLTIAVNAVTTWRKRGIHLLPGTQSLDTALMGDKLIRDLMNGFNGIGHRMDKLSSHMGGITGDPTVLPRDLPGAGFINGFDNRPGAQFATKYAPEKVRPGDGALTDIPHLAGIIASTPLQYDPAVDGLFGSWQISHQHVFDTWYGRQDGGAQVPAVAGHAAVPAAAAEGIPLPTSDELNMVLGYIRANPGWHSYAEVMREFTAQELSLAAVKSVAAVLKSRGQAELGDKQLQAA